MQGTSFSAWFARGQTAAAFRAASAALTLAFGWCAFALPSGPDSYARAATFGPLIGTLQIRAGTKPQQSKTTSVPGQDSLSDFHQDLTTGGTHQAVASLTTSRVGGSVFAFSAVASSITTRPVDPTNPNATSAINFVQSFSTTTPQWLQLAAGVNSSPTDPEVFTFLTQDGRHVARPRGAPRGIARRRRPR